MSETPIQPTERKIEDTLAQLAKALDLHQEAAIADALDLYLAKPERQVGINPTSQYAEVIQAFRRAMADNLSLIELAAQVISLANEIATRFAGISPLAVSRAFFSGDPAQLTAALTPIGRTAAPSDPVVSDPQTGEPCPLTAAWQKLTGQLASNIGSKVRGRFADMLGGLLPK